MQTMRDKKILKNYFIASMSIELLKETPNHILRKSKSKNYDIYVGKPRKYLGQSIDQGKA